MFHWIMEVQSYDQDGWKYIEKMTEISVHISQGSTLDSSFMMAVDCITKTGSVDCDQAEDNSETLSAILSAIANFKLPTMSPTTTAKPSITPTDHPTVSPSSSPSAAPTSSFAPTGSPIIFEYPSREFVETIIKEMKDYQLEIERDIIAPKNTDEISLYSFEGFVETLKIMSEGTVKNKYFYIGHGKPTNRVIKKRGLVNIALFLAHTKTVAIVRTLQYIHRTSVDYNTSHF